MQCPRCQHENSSRARFCEACGTPLAGPNQGGPPAASYADLQREVEHLTRALSESLEQHEPAGSCGPAPPGGPLRVGESAKKPRVIGGDAESIPRRS
jgi:hypothetical protein